MTDQSNSSPEFGERRRYRRYTIDVGIKVKISSPEGISTYCFGRGGDVGEGGLAIHVPLELEIGKAIEITLTLPYTERGIVCRVIVRNRDGFKYGVEFREMNAQDRELLIAACRRLGIVQSI